MSGYFNLGIDAQTAGRVDKLSTFQAGLTPDPHQTQLKLQMKGSGNLPLWAPAGSRPAHWYLVGVRKAHARFRGNDKSHRPGGRPDLRSSPSSPAPPPPPALPPPRSQVLSFNLVNLHLCVKPRPFHNPSQAQSTAL